MNHKLALPFLLALPAFASACADDATGREDGTLSLGNETTGIPGDGDGDGESGSSTGDGDPSTTGDGDGDPTTTGDGDGDPTTTGDGDGDPTTTGDGDGDGDGDPSTTGDGDGDPPLFCNPGANVCANANAYQTCVEDGTSYGNPVACAGNEGCYNGQCVSQCDLIQGTPSSVGCSFVATKHDNFTSNVNNASMNDSLIAGNISQTESVNAQLYFIPIGSNVEQAEGPAVVIPAQGTYTWSLSVPEINKVTLKRQGGVYRLQTDLPVVAYQHSPIGSSATNDASMLLPDYALTGNYVVASYQATVGNYPSYLMAISITDGTVVDLTAGGATAAGTGFPALAAGASTQFVLNRYELLNLVVAQQNGGDLSGTIISANQPLHVVGATECGNIPGPNTFCDHLEEVMFPLEYWGEEYVGAMAPQRNNEFFHWRVYGGEDGITVNTTPQQPGFPIQLNKGQFYQFATKQNFVFTGTGPFMPVQYLEGTNPNAGTGDPGMYQMVPTEQFLSSYAFVTGTNYNQHYAQIIRPSGGADVTIDGNVVGGYTQIGAYQVANVQVSEGAHFATSAEPFGITQVGYTPVTSYAYPGGLKLEIINPQ
jgi:hypothetical protein